MKACRQVLLVVYLPVEEREAPDQACDLVSSLGI